MSVRILRGHCLDRLAELPAESVQMCCTSVPYFGLRSYGTEPQVWGGDSTHAHEWTMVPSAGYRSNDDKPGVLQTPGNTGRTGLVGASCACGSWRGELGLEPTSAAYVANIACVFRAVWRVLRADGTLWLNIGDSYASSWASGRRNIVGNGSRDNRLDRRSDGLKEKDLMLMPARVALALQADGWWVRSDIAWCKTSAMPESVQDRPTSAWEHIFLLSKSAKYFYDIDAVRTQTGSEVAPEEYARLKVETSEAWYQRQTNPFGEGKKSGNKQGGISHPLGANLRNFWLLGPEPLKEAHFAAFPTEIPRRCILAGSRPGDTILDPFGGSGTTGLVADRLERNAVLIELNPTYVQMAERRVSADAPMFADVSAA